MPATKQSPLILPRNVHDWNSPPNIEVLNAIVERSGPFIKFDLLTEEVGRLREFGFECHEELRDRFLQQGHERHLKNRPPKQPTYVLLGTGPTHEKEFSPPAWVDSPAQILDHLESQATSPDDMETAILVAEVTDFQEELLERLLAALGTFIESKRFASDEETTTLLGSAIRKYAMNMGPLHFDRYSKWLLPTTTHYLDTIVELELVKGVSWRLTFEPIAITDDRHLQELIATVKELQEDYIQPRLVVQKNYAATAIEATVALVLLHASVGANENARQLLGAVSERSPEWVSNLVHDQLQEAVSYVSDHDADLADRLRAILAN